MSSRSSIASEHRNIRLCSGLYRKIKVERHPLSDSRLSPSATCLIALETYRAAVKRWPNAKIKVRNRGMGHRAEQGRTENCRLIASVGDRAFTLCFPSTGERLQGGIARGLKFVRLIATICKGKIDRPYPRRYVSGALNSAIRPTISSPPSRTPFLIA